MTIQQAKDKYAIENFGEDWANATFGFAAAEIDVHMEDVAKIYAKSCVEASLKKAADNYEKFERSNGHSTSVYEKIAIISSDNIVIN